MQSQKQKEVTVNIIPEYKELYSDKWRYLVYYGGRGSGKSYNVAESLILRGRENKLRILCTREVQNTIRDSVHKLLCDIIEKYGFSDYKTTKDSIINSKTGTEFIFKGLRHNIAEIKSTEGIDVCWVEEGQGVSKESWEILTPTIRKPKSRIIVTLNRLNENDPVWVKFCIKPSSYTYISKVNYDVMEKYGLFPDVLKLEMEADKEEIDPYIQGRIQDMMRYILVTIPKRRIEDTEEKEEYRRIVRKIVDELRKTGADELTKVINEVHGCIVKEMDKEGYFKEKESEINEVLYVISGALQTIRGRHHGKEYKVGVDIKRLIRAIER